MKGRSVFKSFRFEIVLYAILSLLYTVVTETLVYCFIYYSRVLVMGIMSASQKNISLNKAIVNILSTPITNGTSFIDGYSSTGLTHSLTAVFTVNRDYLISLIIFSLFFGMILFVVYFLLMTKRFSRYLFEISDGIRTIASGNFDTRIRIMNEDEFAIIATSVNKMASDISEMIENEHKREQQKHELITNVAHDLRTPLTSIIGYLELAKRDGVNEEERGRYLEIAYDKSKRLEGLLEDLFSFTKFTSGEVIVQKVRLDLVKLVEQMIEEFYPSFEEASLNYEFKTNVEHAYIQADGNLLARLFANLISNAIKYGKHGKKIEFEIIKYGNEVCVSIINYGTIIPTQELPNIFDKFYRVENSRSMDTGGTGLGLAIAKKIVTLHGGELIAKSDLDGTEFMTKLPLEREEE